MSLSLTINGVDFTSKWRLYESRWTARAYLGESSQSEFVIDDDAGDIDHGDLASKKIVEVWEDASGSSVCMYRGRVANKGLGRSPRLTALSMRWIVSAEDYNIDLRGLRVTDSGRPEESDRERVLAYMTAYLNGAASFNSHARDTTELDGGFVVNADLVTLPTEDYADTFPAEVFARICEISAKTFFVFVDDAGQGQLYYATHTDTSYASDISITDAGTADGVNIFAPYVSNNSGEHDGQRTITGGGVRYGEDEFFELSDVAGSEADHDKWEEHFTDEYLVNVGSATSFITNQVASRNNEDFTFISTIDMRAEDAHRIKAGMSVPVLIRSADKPASSEQRAVQVTHEPQHPDEDGNAWYKVTIEFGVPRGRPFRRNLRSRPGPFAPGQPVDPDPGEVIRLYFTDHEVGTADGSGSASAPAGVSFGAPWDNVSDPDVRITMLNTVPQNSRNGATSTTTYNDTAHGMFLYPIDATWAAILAAGGATVNGRIRTSARSGVGIDEGAQDMISQMVIKVTVGATAAIRGTALAGHTLPSSSGSTQWAAQTTTVSRQFPAAAASDTLSAVSGAAAGDYIVVEVGYCNFTVSPEPTGGSMYFRDSTTAGDLPENETDATNLNSWLEITGPDSGGSAGSVPEPVVGDGEGAPGSSNVYSPIDHLHAHGLLSADAQFMHSYGQVSAERTRADVDPTVNDDNDDGYRGGHWWLNEVSGDIFVLFDGTVGAAVWRKLYPQAGAPTTADYLVGTTNASLSAEIVVGTTPGGELGGTWAAPTVDGTHSGSAHHTRLHAITDVLDHSASGLTTGHVLTATSATAFAFQAAAGGATHFEVLLTEDGTEPISTEDGLDWIYVEVAN